jgi:hypothetical protein
MPTEARNRAQRCRERADECMLIAARSEEAGVKKQYRQISEYYLRSADPEQTFPARLEKPGSLKGRPLIKLPDLTN